MKNGDNYPVNWEDFKVTPIDKYAKKTDNKLSKKNPIVTVHQNFGALVDDSVKSLPLPEKPVEEESKEESADVQNLVAESKEPTEKFEQISIFDDDFE